MTKSRTSAKARKEPSGLDVPGGLEAMRSKGYAVVVAENPEALIALRDRVVATAAELLGVTPEDPERFLNRFHERGIGDVALNEFRVTLIQRLTATANAGEAIWEAFPSLLLGLVGPDILVQKGTNLVIQQPNASDGTPIHRDAPPNSAFEVVVWLPLVDCFGTKGMHILDVDETREGVAIQLANVKDQDALDAHVWSHGAVPTVPFGTALFFWTGLVHAVPKNQEAETRWSLNIRYKNLFSPFGTKAMPEHFRILALSPLTKLAMDNKSHQVLSSVYGTLGR